MIENEREFLIKKAQCDAIADSIRHQERKIRFEKSHLDALIRQWEDLVNQITDWETSQILKKTTCAENNGLSTYYVAPDLPLPDPQ